MQFSGDPGHVGVEESGDDAPRVALDTGRVVGGQRFDGECPHERGDPLVAATRRGLEDLLRPGPGVGQSRPDPPGVLHAHVDPSQVRMREDLAVEPVEQRRVHELGLLERDLQSGPLDADRRGVVVRDDRGRSAELLRVGLDAPRRLRFICCGLPPVPLSRTRLRRSRPLRRASTLPLTTAPFAATLLASPRAARGGLGTYRLNGFEGAAAVATALRAGYRLVDSAFNYENEAAVGSGVRDSGADRSGVVFTSKLAGRHHGTAAARTAIEESVLRSGLGHIDLLLIHWPNPSRGFYVEAWKALIDAQERGLVTHIGVSNFLPEHLERIEDATGVRPAVNQIELHQIGRAHV